MLGISNQKHFLSKALGKTNRMYILSTFLVRKIHKQEHYAEDEDYNSSA